MKTRTVVVASASGLHARPAQLFTQRAKGSNVTIAKVGEDAVDASSILRVMALGIQHGDSVILSGDDNAVDTLSNLLETDLDTH